MNKQVNTISRFIIAVLFIARGISRIISYEQFYQTIENIGIPMPLVLMSLIIGIELGGGLFLFFGYKVSAVSKCLIIGTILAVFLFQNHLLPILNNLAIIAGLMLLINSGGGETFFEYAKTDIQNLPDYKTRL